MSIDSDSDIGFVKTGGIIPNPDSQNNNKNFSYKTALKDLQIYYDKVLGKGSFSKVFPGKYKNNLVAIKIISTKDLEPKVSKQLERELDVINLLQSEPHNNIVTYYKIVQTNDKMIIVMELCAGGELSKHIKQGLDVSTIKSYFKQIVNGYKHLLELNIIHRDIKSANILVSQDSKTVKFIDFGLSKIITSDLNKTVCGSPLYMAPELLEHKHYDKKSDIWSLGILLYEMVYGFTPFHECKVIKTLKESVKSKKIIFPKKSHSDLFIVPDKLIDLLKQLLETDPSKRLDWNDILLSSWFTDNDDDDDNINDIKDLAINYNSNNKSVPKSIPISIPSNNNNNRNKHKHSHTYDYDYSHHDAKIDPFDDDSFTPSDLHDSCNESSISNSTLTMTSKPIPIMNNKTNRSRRSTSIDTFSSSPYSYNSVERGSFKNPSKYLEHIEQIPKMSQIIKNESFKEYKHKDCADLKIDDISFIKNSCNDEKCLNTLATDSGLIDITDVDEIIMTNKSTKSQSSNIHTVAYEYISRGSSIIGSYLYSKSAPVASIATSMFSGLGKLVKKNF